MGTKSERREDQKRVQSGKQISESSLGTGFGLCRDGGDQKRTH